MEPLEIIKKTTPDGYLYFYRQLPDKSMILSYALYEDLNKYAKLVGRNIEEEIVGLIEPNKSTILKDEDGKIIYTSSRGIEK